MRSSHYWALDICVLSIAHGTDRKFNRIKPSKVWIERVKTPRCLKLEPLTHLSGVFLLTTPPCIAG